LYRVSPRDTSRPRSRVRSAFDRDQHHPVDRETARAAAVELRQRGLTPADIAAALRLSEGAIRDLLEASS
jgi:DNA-binding NarL/FixJ family response regulator